MMIAIGQISRPHGVDGTVRVIPLTDTPGRIQALTQIAAEKADGSSVILIVASARETTGALLLKFQGIDSLEQADQLRDAYLLVPREAVPPLPENTFYVFDLIGFEVQTEDGQAIGILSDVLRLPANDAYVVRREHQEVLIPAVRDFVRVDTKQKKVFVHGIEDLLS
jgi:16S rRNA processing protein RimM